MDRFHPQKQRQEQEHPRCRHGVCLKHEPEWLEIWGEKHWIPNPGILGNKTYWGEWCCKSPMARYKTLQIMRCQKCGFTIATKKVTHKFALCLCCGAHKEK